MDVRLCETGNGGDFLFINRDFSLTEGMNNHFYLGWFGGNIGSDENDREDLPQSEERFEWWGNEVLFPNELDFRANSQLESALNQTELSSNGRLFLEEVAKNDLAFMSDFGEVDVNVIITGVDRVEINSKITQLGNQEDRTFSFIWDSTKNEADCSCDNYVSKSDYVQTGDYFIGDYSSTDYLT